MIGHTPGPWEIRGGMTPQYTTIVSPRGDVVDGFGNPRHPSRTDAPGIPLEEHRANARLIAAAPDLLKAVQAWRVYYSDLPEDHTALMDEAIEKTEIAVLKVKEVII